MLLRIGARKFLDLLDQWIWDPEWIFIRILDSQNNLSGATFKSSLYFFLMYRYHNIDYVASNSTNYTTNPHALFEEIF
jgi:hypothetical protein